MTDVSDDKAPRGWVNFNTVFGLLAIVFGVVLFIITPDQVERPRLLFGQKPSGLDPDFFPRMVAVFFMIVGVWLVWRARTLREDNHMTALDGEGIMSVLFTIGGFLVMAALMPWLGFVISSFILLLVLSTFYGNRNILLGLLVSAGVPLVFFNVLRVWLKVVLPQDP
ncbi:MAG: tripartite tricarboxylate transporter TctB family protein, partial [Rhodospirillaceae bacterium]|nr:tripartite tricarboxylate transporter TctB family protein [Rhodospirillaceae bacterium]